MTVIDDWTHYLKEQVANAEKWTKENPLATGLIIVVVGMVGTFVASKAYDVWLRG